MVTVSRPLLSALQASSLLSNRPPTSWMISSRATGGRTVPGRIRGIFRWIGRGAVRAAGAARRRNAVPAGLGDADARVCRHGEAVGRDGGGSFKNQSSRVSWIE